MSVVSTENNVSLFKIERMLEFAVSIERVWSAITDAQELALWFPNHACDFKPEVGYKGWFEWSKLEDAGRYAVIVESVEKPYLLVWRWASTPDTPVNECRSTLVEWRLETIGDERTRLYLCESGFADEVSHAQNTQGWQHELAELEALLAA